MPVGALIGGAVAGIGGAVISANATKRASQAATDAANQNAQVQREIYDQTRADLQPYNAAGYEALSRLLGSDLSGAPPSVPNWDQYLRDNQDVLASAQAAKQAGDPRSLEEMAQAHYETWGKNEGRLLENQPVYGSLPTYTRPEMSRPEFTQTAPTMGGYGSRPTADTYFKDFKNSPGYQNILNEALRAVNAGSATAGKFYSGNRAIALQNRAAGLADQDYGDWWNRQNTLYQTDLSQYNMDRGFAQQNYNTALQQYNVDRNVLNQNFEADRGYNNNVFNTDRAYGTDVFNQNRAYYTNLQNTQTGNLFNLLNLGQNSAAQTGNAGQNYAAQATANNNALASAQGNAALANANNINNILGQGMQAYGLYAGMKNNNIFAGSGYASI